LRARRDLKNEEQGIPVTGWLAQVKSGIRLALTIVGSMLVILMLFLGVWFVMGATPKAVIWGMVVSLVPIVTLWVTVARWAKWFFALCAMNVLRTVMMLLLGRTISVPSLVAPRILFAKVAGACALLAFLSYRFVHANPNKVDSLCLIGALTACVASVLSKSPLKWVLVAVLLLGACNLYAWFRTRKCSA
jgi:hypothetical protein